MYMYMYILICYMYMYMFATFVYADLHVSLVCVHVTFRPRYNGTRSVHFCSYICSHQCMHTYPSWAFLSPHQTIPWSPGLLAPPEIPHVGVWRSTTMARGGALCVKMPGPSRTLMWSAECLASTLPIVSLLVHHMDEDLDASGLTTSTAQG